MNMVLTSRLRFFYISKGSAAELLTQAIISSEIGYIGNDDFKYIIKECKAISAMLTNLIKARAKKL